MKNNTKATEKANASANVMSSLNLSVLKAFIDSLRKADEKLNDVWNERKGDEKLESLGKYLENEALKMIVEKPSYGAVPVYVEDATMRNWIIDFLTEGNVETETKKETIPASVPVDEAKAEVKKETKKPTSVHAKETKSEPKAKPVFSSP